MNMFQWKNFLHRLLFVDASVIYFIFPAVSFIYSGLILVSIAIGLWFAVPRESSLNPGLLSKSIIQPDEAMKHFLGIAA